MLMNDILRLKHLRIELKLHNSDLEHIMQSRTKRKISVLSDLPAKGKVTPPHVEVLERA